MRRRVQKVRGGDFFMLGLIALLLILQHGIAFLSPSSFHPQRKKLVVIRLPSTASGGGGVLWSSAGFDDHHGGGSGGGGGASWRLTNDFPQFLNQVTIQSFFTVLRSLRDPQTIRWIHNFTQPIIPSSSDRTSVRLTGTTEETNNITSNKAISHPLGESYSRLLTYHGLGAMNTTLFPTWESYFATLLEQPQEQFTVQSTGIQVQDYELEINPPSLCTRLISVREQIAEELAHDLQVVANSMGNHTLDSYWDYMENQMDLETTMDELEERKQYTEIGGGGGSYDDDESGADGAGGGLDYNNQQQDEVTMSSGDGRPRRLPPHNLVFLEYGLDGAGDGWENSCTSSPLRKGNLDLVVLLATQESIHRILNKLPSSDENAQELLPPDFIMYQKYLLDFYAERLVSHFTGIQRYGRADDFLEELLFSSPRVSTEGGFAALVDPVKVAELVLDERHLVALEWSAQSKNIPNDHIAIKRLQLNALMQSYQ